MLVGIEVEGDVEVFAAEIVERKEQANQVAINQFLELNTILQHPKVVADLMVKKGVTPGIALQFVSNIKKFQQEEKNS